MITSKYIFYLHGMIVEVQGVNAVGDDFGHYNYGDFIDSVRSAGYHVHSRVRTPNTDFNTFCMKIPQEFRQLVINSGLGHEFLFRPIKEWLVPTIEWIYSE